MITLALAAASLACSDSKPKPAATSTPRLIPSPVALPSEPADNWHLVDSSFEALPGAKAYSGRLGGTVYRLEVPDNWNHRLVLFMHGSHDNTDNLFVEDPPIRQHLIDNGYAWAASSYSANIDKTSNHARDTAALWDYAVQQIGAPEHSYVMGKSIGGRGTVLSALEYGDRYDGALAVCANASSEADYDYRASAVFVAGAYVAGVTQQQFEGADINALIRDRIQPALADAASRKRWEDIVIDLSGGPRPFDREGLRVGFDQIWGYAASTVTAGLLNNADRVYTFSSNAVVSADDFNARAVRNHDFNTGLHQSIGEPDKYNGQIQIPLLTLHTTGDPANPLYWEKVLHDSVASANRTDLLVQRAVRAAGHCTQTDEELAASLDALVAWVERGEKPDGEDLTGSLADAGKFTLAERPSDPLDAATREWLDGWCALDRQLDIGTAQIPNANQDPTTLTLEQRRARANVLWPAQLALNREYVAGIDRLSPTARVQALHDALRAAREALAADLERSIAEADTIFTSVDAVEADNARRQNAEDSAFTAANERLRMDAPLLDLYQTLPGCRSGG